MIQEFTIPIGSVVLEAALDIPSARCHGLVVFVHGSGSGRHSPRNLQVALHLKQLGLATLLVDLLSSAESKEDERSAVWRFNIELLSQRVVEIIDWLGEHPVLKDLPIGLLGSSTGAAAALMAAAMRADRVSAVVSRGGRPDLAEPLLSYVRAPTLLIVGGNDTRVIELNRRSFNELHCEKAIDIVKGASHLFGEPGTLEEAAISAGEWFERHLHPPLLEPALGSSILH